MTVALSLSLLKLFRSSMAIPIPWPEFGRFDTKSFRYKLIRYKLKLIRDIIKVDSIHVKSQFDSTQYLCSQPLISGLTGAKTLIPVS